MQIDFLCCGEWIQATTQYSNAVLLAILPHVSDFAQKLDLPQLVTPITTNQVERFVPEPKRGRIGGGVELTNGAVFGFNDGIVSYFESPRSFFAQQDPNVIPKFYAPLKLNKTEAVELARQVIRNLGYEIEDVFADLEPRVKLAQGIGTNVVPHYRIQWLDPRSGSTRTEIEINGSRKVPECIRLFGIVAISRPWPTIKVEPGELPEGHPWRGLNKMGENFNPEYAEKLVPIVLSSIEDWTRKLDLKINLPLTTNLVKRFYVSDQGGWPHVEVTLTNNWEFIYRNSGVTYAGSPRRFFESDKLPFRVKNYTGKWQLNERQAIKLAREAVAKLGFPKEFVRTDIKPRVHRPQEINGMPTIPRLEIEWAYPNPDQRTQWIRAEVDCDKGTVEMLSFDDASFWGKPPPIDVPISLPKTDATGGP